MNRLEVGEVVVGSVKGIKPYGAFIDIGCEWSFTYF